MPKPIVVTEAVIETPIHVSGYAGMPEYAFDYVPADADEYVVTFLRGRNKEGGPTRITERGVATLGDAMARARALNAEFGQFGRRALIHAVKGFRSYLVNYEY